MALDGAGGTAVGDGGPQECAKVDVLFVIDDSASMADQQQSLINSFAGFVAAMRDKLAFADSYHVGVITSDAYSGNETSCRKSGALVTRTAGLNSSQSTCIPAGGVRYLDGASATLEQDFACIGKVGTLGADDEKVARSLLDATNPANSALGTCNAGFLREDSLLVVVIITDEDDVPECPDPNDPITCTSTGSGGTPQEWHDTLVGYRSGKDQNIVVLTLLGEQLANTCGAQVASKLIGFTNRFQNGVHGDVCAASYDQFFADALPVIDDACEKFEPPH